MIRLSNVSKTYGAVQALDSISFTVEQGEIVALLGPNGAGKTTTMRTITGYITPTSGHVEVHGNMVNEHRVQAVKHIGYLPENTPLYPDLTVYEHVEMVAGIHGMTGDKKHTAIIRALQQTDLIERKHFLVSALSKGLKQRTGLAMALVHSPKVLILDEPTSGLDPNQIQEIRQVILSLKKHCAILLSTHIMQEVEALADRVVVISKGKCVKVSSIDELYGEKEAFILTALVSGDESVLHEICRSFQGARYTLKNKGDSIAVTLEAHEDIRSLYAKKCIESGLDLREITSSKRSLEDVFSELTR